MQKENNEETFEIEPEITELNEKFFVVASEGGKCRIAYFEKRPLDKHQSRHVLVLQSFEDFKKRFSNRKVIVGHTEEGKPTEKRLGDYWIDHPNRRQFEQIDFLPGIEADPHIYNLWRGFAYAPQKGSWRKLQRHIWRIMAKRDREAFRYIMKWIAWSVQNMREPAEVALVFRGGKGTGKGTLCRWVRNIFGQHGMQIFSSRLITGNFNSHLRDCILLFADEAIAPNSKQAENTLKGILTEPTIPIEGKGLDVIQVPNYLHVMMASNSEWVVPATFDERRFAIFDVSDEVTRSKDWFGSITQEMLNDGASAMLHFMLNLDLGDWHPRDNIPQNKALVDQQAQSLKGCEKIWLDWLYTAEAQGVPDIDGLVFVPTALFAKLAETSNRTAGLFMEQMGCTKKRDNEHGRGYVTPRLSEARQKWNDVYFKMEWDNTEKWAPYKPDIPF